MKRGLIVAACLLLVGLLAQAYHLNAHTAQFHFQHHSLTNSSPQEVGEYAINLTRAKYRILSGMPRIRLVRSVTANDLADLGFGWSEYGGQEPPMILVVLQGDFEGEERGIGASGTVRFQFISYVFDVRDGMQNEISIWPKGIGLRRVLNDPTLPDIPIRPIPRPGTPNPPHNAVPAVPYPAPSSNFNTPAPQSYPAPSASQSTAPVGAPYPTP